MSDKMLAAAKKTAAAGAELIEEEIPKPKPDEVLIKVSACSICGTDKHIYQWDRWAASRIKPPMIFGHECCGEVVEIGSSVKSVSVGDFISAETHIPCGHCYMCRTGNMHLCLNLQILGVDRDGIFAEYAVIPEICCWKNDKSMPVEVASVLEPFGNAVYTVSESNVGAKNIAIIGDGPIAAFACAVSKALGATRIYNLGMKKYNLDICKKMGADVSIDVGKKKDYRVQILEETSGGVDVVLDMAGNKPAVEDGFAILRRMGTFTAFGIASEPFEFDMANNIVFKGAKIIGINGREMFGTWYQAKNLIESGMVDITPVITHQFGFHDFISAIEMSIDPGQNSSKIVLKMPRQV
jgi:threonine 3-dehydrogenase